MAVAPAAAPEVASPPEAVPGPITLNDDDDDDATMTGDDDDDDETMTEDERPIIPEEPLVQEQPRTGGAARPTPRTGGTGSFVTPRCRPGSLDYLLSSINTQSSEKSAGRDDFFPNKVTVGADDDPQEIGIRCSGDAYVLFWPDVVRWICEYRNDDLSLHDGEVSSRIREAATNIRTEAWRTSNMAHASRKNGAVSRHFVQLLGRKFGVPDLAFAELDRAALLFTESAASCTSVRRVRPRSGTPVPAPEPRVETPLNSARRRRPQTVRYLDGALAVVDDDEPSTVICDSIQAAVDVASHSTAQLRALLTPIARTLGRAHSALSKTLRQDLHRTFVQTSTFDFGVGDDEDLTRRARVLATSSRAIEYASGLLPLLNRVGLYRVLGEISRRFEEDGVLRRHTQTLYDVSPTARTDRQHRLDQKIVAGLLASLFETMNGLKLQGVDKRVDPSSAASTGATAPMPTFDVARLVQESIDANAAVPDLPSSVADGALVETAKSAAAVARLLHAIAPTPTIMHLLESTDFGRRILALRFEKGWGDRDAVDVALAFSIAKRRGGISDKTYDQIAMVIDPLLCRTLGAPENSIVVPRSGSIRECWEQHPELFDTPLAHQSVSATFIDTCDDANTASSRADIGFLLFYDSYARRALYEEVLAIQRPGLFRNAERLPPTAEVVVEANRSAVSRWSEFQEAKLAAGGAPPRRDFLITHYGTIHSDAAHLARSRSFVNTIEVTTAILGLTLKQAATNSTDQTLCFFACDCGDAAKYTKKHYMATSPAVPSIVEQITALREGVQYPYPWDSRIMLECKLLLVANDLKGVKEMLRHLGFSAMRDMVWTAESRVSLRFVDDRGYYAYAPISFRYAHVLAVFAAGKNAALHEVLALTGLSEFDLNAVEMAHGSLHFGTCGKALTTQFVKFHLAVGGQSNAGGFLSYIGEGLGHPVECNIKAREVTYPYGGKTGQMRDR
jgi:hypothetical protein